MHIDTILNALDELSPMILIITSKEDITVDYVILKLHSLEAPYLRLNTEDFPSDTTIWAGFDDGSQNIQLKTQSKTYSLTNVSGIWYRRPGIPTAHKNVVDAGFRNYTQHESYEFLQGIYSILPERWLNDPFLIHKAECKPFQLKLAQEIGFHVPRTCIGNSSTAAIELARSLDRDIVVVKPIRNAVVEKQGKEHVVFTNRIESPTLEQISALEYSPCIVQEFIDKQCDIRVTVVGDQVFPVGIDSQSNPETQTDWRVGEHIELAHSRIELPESIKQLCLMLVKRTGLKFSAIDLALGKDGEFYFLELNPNGQWAWIEERVGYDISGCIARQLVSGFPE